MPKKVPLYITALTLEVAQSARILSRQVNASLWHPINMIEFSTSIERRYLPGAALGRFDRLLQIEPRAERGPAFFSKADNLGKSSRSSGGLPERDCADAITCVHSASQRPAVKPVVTSITNVLRIFRGAPQASN